MIASRKSSCTGRGLSILLLGVAAEVIEVSAVPYCRVTEKVRSPKRAWYDSRAGVPQPFILRCESEQRRGRNACRPEPSNSTTQGRATDLSSPMMAARMCLCT
jgi:hypothetical protein